MAQKVIVEMVDDLEGSPGGDVTTVGFALDGRSYEIDLNSRNAEKLRDSLAEFIAASRRHRAGRGGGTAKVAPAHDSAARERAHAIREWAREAGHEVSGRGRIPAAVVDAYAQAQQAPEPAPKAAATKAAAPKAAATKAAATKAAATKAATTKAATTKAAAPKAAAAKAAAPKSTATRTAANREAKPAKKAAKKPAKSADPKQPMFSG